MELKGLCYFLGSNSTEGFYSYYDYLIDKNKAEGLYVIKGGPGCGKSTFMKKVADAVQSKGFEVHKIYCSGDPNSLDGVYFPELNKAIVDGTAPHIIDPVYPGAVDSIIHFGAYWNENILIENKEKIIESFNIYKKHYETAYRFLSTVGNVVKDNYNGIANNINTYKIAEFTDKIIRTNKITGKPTKSNINYRFLSGYTCKGYVSFAKNLSDYADKTIVIKDYSGIGSAVLQLLSAKLIAHGVDFDAYASPFFPQIDLNAIYIPEKKLAVILSTKQLPAILDNITNISATRFLDKEVIKSRKAKYDFNNKLIKKLLDNSVEYLEKAKNEHDGIEKYYISSMDFESIHQLAEHYIKKILE